MIPSATHVYTEDPVDLDDPLIDCPRCKGSGEIQFNLSRNRDPQCDDSALCNVCNGDGMVRADDFHNENEARGADTPGPQTHHGKDPS